LAVCSEEGWLDRMAGSIFKLSRTSILFSIMTELNGILLKSARISFYPQAQQDIFYLLIIAMTSVK
jgi:hypothetical protein